VKKLEDIDSLQSNEEAASLGLITPPMVKPMFIFPFFNFNWGFIFKINIALLNLNKKPDNACTLDCSNINSDCLGLHPEYKTFQTNPKLFLMLGNPALQACKAASSGGDCNNCTAINSFGLEFFGTDLFALFIKFLKERVCEINCGSNYPIKVDNSTFQRGCEATWDKFEEFQNELTKTPIWAKMMVESRLAISKMKWTEETNIYKLLLANGWEEMFTNRTSRARGLRGFVYSFSNLFTNNPFLSRLKNNIANRVHSLYSGLRQASSRQVGPRQAIPRPSFNNRIYAGIRNIRNRFNR